MMAPRQKLAIAGATVASLLPAAVLAQDYNYDYNTDLSAGEATAAAGLGIFFIILFGIMAIVGLIATIFWIMMLIHAASKDIDDKGLWLVVILIGGAIGAVVYYFVVKKKYDAAHPAASKSAQPPAAPPTHPADDKKK